MSILIILPTKEEYRLVVQSCASQGLQPDETEVGRLAATQIPAFDLILIQGGLGKVQFAIKTQYALDHVPTCDLLMCAGAAGGLIDGVQVGDVVVATRTVEHDFNNRFGKRRIPKYDGAPQIIEALRTFSASENGFQVRFGPIASGDEDIIDADRRNAVHQLTEALAVAWEGIGGAKACAFSKVPFVEIRGITDAANHTAASDYQKNLEAAMQHVATVVIWLAKNAFAHESHE